VGEKVIQDGSVKNKGMVKEVKKHLKVRGEGGGGVIFLVLKSILNIVKKVK
jgi:hypothetical protein